VIPIEIAYLEPHGEVRVRPGTEFVTGMQIDSRRIVEGDLFVAMGAGEEFIDDAFARGAAAVLIPKYAHTALGTIGGEVRRRVSSGSQARRVRRRPRTSSPPSAHRTYAPWRRRRTTTTRSECR